MAFLFSVKLTLTEYAKDKRHNSFIMKTLFPLVFVKFMRFSIRGFKIIKSNS